MLALHCSSGGVEEEEEEENPGPGEPSEGQRVPIPHGGEGMSPGDLHPTPHPSPAQSPGQPGGGRATPAKGPEGPVGAARGKREERGLPAERSLSQTPPAPVLSGLRPFNPLSARALSREKFWELGRCWVSPNWGKTPQTLGSSACLFRRSGILQAQPFSQGL